MERKKGYRADDINRGETPGKNRDKQSNSYDDMEVYRERNKRHERRRKHDKEDIEDDE